MEISPRQLAALCVAVFGGIVAINFAQQYRSNAAFRDSLSSLDFSGLRSRLIKEEGIEMEAPSYEGFPAILEQEVEATPEDN